MPGLVNPLIPLDAARVGSITAVPDASRPVAAIVAADSTVSWVVWPDAPMPETAVGEAQMLPTSTGAWLIYTAENDDGTEMLQRRSAVFITAQGVGAACDLGVGQPMGADAGGLWVGDPRPASNWTESADTESEDLEDPELEGLDPESLGWAPTEPFWSRPVKEEAASSSDDGGGEEGFGYFPLAPGGAEWVDGTDSDDDGGPGLVPRAPGKSLPTPATELVRIHTDGTRSVIVVDHLVHGADLTGTRLTVQYYPTGPREVQDQQYAGSTFVDEAREVEVDVSEGLPASIVTDRLPSRPVLDDDDDDSWYADLERKRSAVAEWTDRLDLDRVEGAKWTLVALTEEERAEAIERIRGRFEGFDDPYVVWTHDHPSPRRSPSDYRNVHITEEGGWPATAIVVSFEHRAVPDLRLRRRYGVFDDAGRPREWAYATVHLEEDISTGAIPPRSAAVDGVLEI
ncbi:hypothetical protein E8P82_01175 [Arthrobacter echini]|uniref:Uncharacterized protein n=1 Tax=Arthrobacter echini TaxID=1529066 RepID=A0A4S5EA65_9MICC|nr:hypothetical protein [Arthrobacter echini]THJ68554.1 hypothetical protein E8P82_01175 [Arthrobacter echini]